jgi:DNA modification methylase
MTSPFTLHHGDCLEVLRSMPDASVHAVVTDPPYGLSFMGRKWDYDVPSVDIWRECLRVLKPGGHLLAFAGTRTQHRMAVRIEDAGFEIRDMIAWVYGSGFPKSLDVSKAIDKAAGAEREVVGSRKLTGTARIIGGQGGATAGRSADAYDEGETRDTLAITAPATPEAQQWSGWGTALKPALEPITMARKPLQGTVAANVLQHGCGGLNVDGCRVDASGADLSCVHNTSLGSASGGIYGKAGAFVSKGSPLGRWPANLIHDGSDEVVGLFPLSNSNATPRNRSPKADRTQWRNGGAEYSDTTEYGDTGSAARFFYTAKAAKTERQGVTHPTVKPLGLMRYLVRLVTPPGGIVLDPFMGSGTTIKGAISEGFQAVGIEREAEYFAMAEQRLNGAQIGLPLAM